MPTVRKVINDLLSFDPDSELTISVDVSTCEEDSERRVFTDEYFGVNCGDERETVILFHGTKNYEEN